MTVPYKIWGSGLEPGCIEQLDKACSLPISVRGALMADGHVGYGLPIGGVLATNNAVIPYAVGLDIACRMRISVFDVDPCIPLYLTSNGGRDNLKDAIHVSTKFGVGSKYESPQDHPVMISEVWDEIPTMRELKEKAWEQLGTSGSGNHFAEWGILTLSAPDLGLKAGRYLAFLTHSGSRGTGATAATHYSKLAQEQHPELGELKNLSWFSLDSDLGKEYWAVMELLGKYAAANHELIHKNIQNYLGLDPIFELENHHNFAWKENHFGQDVIVHRKGATPAGKGVLGIIPGSMATPGFICRGLGNPESMNSASHGAGRAMSRKATKKNFKWKDGRKLLEENGVELISAGLDEIPQAYKDIHKVMAAQTDLVEVVARFDPKIVKMAGENEKPED